MTRNAFSIPASLPHPERPSQSVTLDLLVDTSATWMMLPQKVVAQLDLTAPRQCAVTLASSERVTYPVGQVAIRLCASLAA